MARESRIDRFESIMIETDRLMLRQWRNEDLQPFASLNADPEVMRYFPTTYSSAQSNAMAQRCHDLIAEREWGFWAVSLLDTGEFIGFTGLHVPSSKLPFFPCVEIGWRLRRQFWRQGYATEAARASLWFGFEIIGLPEIVSFASAVNKPSIGVMEKLGMTNQYRNFPHPLVSNNPELEEHVLYAMKREEWLQREAQR